MEPSGVVEEPISSELALVDRELARRARAALPDPPWLLPVLAELQERETEPPVAVRERVVPAPERATRRSIASRIPAAAFVVLLLLAAAVLAVSALPPSQGPSFVTEPARRAAVPAQKPPPAERPKRPAKRSQVRRTPKPAIRHAEQTARTKRVAPNPAASARPRTRTLAKARRVFRWHRYPAAVYYELHLQRGTKTIYETRTVKLSAALPARLGLRPGAYQVLVRAAIPGDAGIILGPAVLQKTLRI